MKLFGKIVLGILFILLVIFFVLVGTIRFELLNSSFLFGSFERNNVYAKLPYVLAQSLPNDPNIPKEERGDYTKIVANINPDTAKKIIESNFLQILNFINGKSDDVTISISAKELGIPGMDINWSLSQMPNAQSDIKVATARGIGNKILLPWFVLLVLLGGLFLLYGRLTKPKNLVGGKTLLLTGGIIITILGIVARIFSLVLEKSMPQKLEPSQALIKLLSSSLFPDITITWIVFGVILIILWMSIRFVVRR